MMGARLTLAAALALGACSGLKTYPNDGLKNVHVATQTERGVRAALHVHEVNGECATRYQGTLALDQRWHAGDAALGLRVRTRRALQAGHLRYRPARNRPRQRR